MIKHQGGCHCGNIRYSTTYDPMLVMACHCRTCNKISGVGTTVFAVYAEGEVDFEGELTTYPYRGESGQFVHQGFCAKCGNNIYGNPEILEGVMFLHLGSFDNPLAFTPKVEIWNKTKPTWFSGAGCVVESFEDNGTIERIQILMENMDQRQ